MLSPKDINQWFPTHLNQPYDSYRIIDSLLDNHSFCEYKKDYGKTIITGYGRVHGWHIGIVINQRKVMKNARGELQIGGVIYSDSADKAARFVMNCNQKGLPLVFIQDVTGFMVGRASEHLGIIKDGAKMVNAVANSVVPKITLIIGNSYGAGNYAMCGKAYQPRFIYAWPSARIGVMGGAQAVKVLQQIATKSKSSSSQLSEKAFIDNIKKKYDAQLDIRYAAARLWVDAIVEPCATRKVIAHSLRWTDNNPTLSPFNVGVIQV